MRYLSRLWTFLMVIKLRIIDFVSEVRYHFSSNGIIFLRRCKITIKTNKGVDYSNQIMVDFYHILSIFICTHRNINNLNDLEINNLKIQIHNY